MLPSRELPASRAVVAGIAVVLVAAGIGGAVAFGVFGGDGGALGQVPDADVVATVDPAITDDARTRRLLDAGFASAGAESVTGEELLAGFESETGLDLDGLETVVAYGRYTDAGRLDPAYAGVIVHANWSQGDVIEALSATTGARYVERDADDTSGDATVYRPANPARVRAPTVAVLANGEFAIGTRSAVEGAAAVASGDGEALGASLRTAVERTDGGLVTVAARIPRARLDVLSDRLRSLTRLESIRSATVVYDTTVEGIALRAQLLTNGTEAARDIAALIRGGLPLAASRLDNETAAGVVRSVDVEREGTDVRMSLNTTVTELRTVAAYYGLAEYAGVVSYYGLGRYVDGVPADNETGRASPIHGDTTNRRPADGPTAVTPVTVGDDRRPATGRVGT